MAIVITQPPAKAVRWAQNSSTTVNANSDSPKATLFTVPTGRKFTVIGVGTDQNVASVSLLAQHIIGQQAVSIVDIPSQRLSTDDRMLPLYEVFNVGESLTLGLRNSTGAGITPQLTVCYLDESA